MTKTQQQIDALAELYAEPNSDGAPADRVRELLAEAATLNDRARQKRSPSPVAGQRFSRGTVLTLPYVTKRLDPYFRGGVTYFRLRDIRRIALLRHVELPAGHC